MIQNYSNFYQLYAMSRKAILVIVVLFLNMKLYLAATSETIILKDYFFPLKQGNTWTYKQIGFGNEVLFANRVTVTDQNYSFSSYISEIKSYGRNTVELLYQYPSHDQYTNSDYLKEYYGKGASYRIYGLEEFVADEFSYGEFYPKVEFRERFKVNQSITKKTNFIVGDRSKLPVSLTIKLIAFENVVVPAGSFNNCAHLRFSLKSEQSPASTTDEWWAKGVGPVKVKQRGDDGRAYHSVMTSISKSMLLSVYGDDGSKVENGMISFRDDHSNIKSEVTLSITNLGNKTLFGLTATISKSNLYQIKIPPIGVLKPHETTEILILYSGEDFPYNSAKLTIADNDPKTEDVILVPYNLNYY